MGNRRVASDQEQHKELATLMAEFVDRFRLGEHPSVTEYVQRCPDLEEEIRDLFPTLAIIEQIGDGDGGTLGSDEQITQDGKTLKQLGDYRILREVGRGGMGVVYEAEQESLGRHVALKVLPHYALLDPKQLQRFRREARAAAQLHHSNIVPVFGVGEADGVHFYAMQFIQGLGLDEVLDELRTLRGWERDPNEESRPSQTARVAEELLSGTFGSVKQESRQPDAGSAQPNSQSLTSQPNTVREKKRDHGIRANDSSTAVVLPGQTDLSTSAPSDHHYFRSVARVGVQVADALEYAHSQGVLHRDVKPSNLLLDTDSTVWVTDFGLAKTDDEDLTHTGDFVGTLRYMAPERFRGWSDPRSDVYSLGLTLYEMVTLRPAFLGTDRAALVRSVTQDDPPRPRRIDRHIPRDLETILLKANCKEPQSRYQSAGEIAEDLRRFLADKPLVARRTSVGERVLRLCRRNPLVAGLTTAVVILLAVLTVGSWVANFRLGERHRAALSNLQRAKTAEANERTARQQATVHLYDAYLAQARAGRWSGRAGRRFGGLQALERAAELRSELGLGQDATLELRNEAIACLSLVDLRISKVWEEPGPFQSSQPRWGFDSAVARYALVDAKGVTLVRRLSDNSELLRLEELWYTAPEYVCPYLCFSPDDRYLAGRGYAADGLLRVRLWNLQDRNCVVDQVSSGFYYETALAFSPDSRQIAFMSQDHTLVLHDTNTGEVAKSLELGYHVNCLAFSSDGQHLATDIDTGVQVVKVATGESEYRFETPGFVPYIAWSPDDRLLAAACDDMKVHLWDTEHPTHPPLVVSGHLSKTRTVAFSPSGNLLMSTAWDRTTRIWDPVDGNELVSLALRGCRFSADGKWLAFEEPGVTVGRCEVEGALECRLLHSGSPTDSVIELNFSPDGNYLVSIGRGEGILVWDIRNLRQVIRILFYEQPRSAAFAPDGRHLITSGSGGVDRWPIEAVLAGNYENLLSSREIIGRSDPSYPCEFAINPDGEVLAASFADNIVDTFHPDSSLDYLRMAGPCETWFVAMSPDANWVAAAAKSNSDIPVWNGQTAERVADLHSTKPGALVTFSPDGRQLVVSESSQFVFYDVANWQEARRLANEGPCFGRVAFSPDQQILAVGRQGDVKLYRAETLDELATLVGPRQEQVSTTYPEGAGDIAFSPDGQTLAVGTMQGTIQLWDLKLIRARLRRLDLDW